jgi:hypothetical protein
VSRPSRLLSRRGLRDKRGAVYVEFLAAFWPIFLSFWCLLQSSGLYTAKLVTMHSAYLGVRAAAVVLADKDKKYGGEERYAADGKRKDAIVRAVQMGLSADTSLIWPLAEVTLEGGNGKEKESFGRDQVVVVRVDVPYHCGLPIADKIVCGFGGLRTVSAEAKMVVHGADYEYGE